MLRKNKKAFSLIEVLLALAIVLIAIVASIIIYSQTSASLKIEKEMKFINTLKGVVIDHYRNSPDYSTLTNKILIDSDLINSDQITKNGDIRSFMGKTFTASPYYDGVGFMFSLTGLSTSECINLLPKVSPSFTLINKTVSPSSITPSNAIDYCKDGDLSLIYSNIQAPYFPGHITTTNFLISTYPTINKADGSSINKNNSITFGNYNFSDETYFAFAISENNANNALISYLQSQINGTTGNDLQTRSSSTGFSQTGCSITNGSMMQLKPCTQKTFGINEMLNILANVPKSVIEESEKNGGFNISYNTKLSKRVQDNNTYDSICKSGAFTCTATYYNSTDGVASGFKITLKGQK